MLLIEFILCATFACAYLTQALRFDGSSGPWPSHTLVVRVNHVEDRPIDRPVDLFDRFRRLFGAYIVNDNVWTVNPLRIPVWECGFCLSFWVSLIICVPYLAVFMYPLWLFPLVVLMVAQASQLVMR